MQSGSDACDIIQQKMFQVNDPPSRIKTDPDIRDSQKYDNYH